jgi:hypothetical protein
MPYIAGTDVPQQIVASCPRCHALRTMSSANDGALGYICNGCEWGMIIGAGTTVLTTNAGTSAGGTALPFASGGTAFSAGQYLWYPGANPEIVLVTGPVTGTSVGISPLQFSHATTQAISVATAAIEFPNQGNAPPNPGWGF